jgi:hypothetical protein
MAQIIKHRRGSIDSLSSATAKKGELVMATGSVGNMNGPWIFVGETEGSAGAFRSLSKIYQGTSAPNLTVGTWGSTLNGTPFYASSNESLTILSNSGNVVMDLTGNIEGNVISGVTINNLTGTTIDISSDLTVGGDTTLSGDLYITGNTYQTGNIDLDGNVTLTGNITIGDQTTDIIQFGGEVSSSIVPLVNNSFDLGSPTNAWKDLYVSGTAYIETINIGEVSLTNLALPGDLTVSGTTTLSGSVFVEDLTQGRIVHVGADGQLVDNENFTYDLINGFLMNTSGSVNINTSGSVNIITEDASEIYFSSSANFVIDAESDFTVNSSDDIRITANDIFSLRNSGVGESITLVTNYNDINEKTLTFDSDGNLTVPEGFTGSYLDINTQAQLASAAVEDLTSGRIVLAGVGGELEDDANFTFDGTTFKIGDGDFEVNVGDGNIRTSGSLTVEGGTQLNGDLTVSGNFTVLGSATEVHISSSVIELDDNIIRLNAYSPFERYAGFEVIDSGSVGVSASLVWDSQNDYWLFVSSSGESSKLIGTTAGTYGSENSLTNNTIVKATGGSNIGDSLLTDNATTLAYNTNKFTVDSSDGATLIAGNVTLSAGGGADGGTNTSAIVFRNSSNVLGYVSTTETTDELDGILGYKNSDGALVFSTVIDGGTY